MKSIYLLKGFTGFDDDEDHWNVCACATRLEADVIKKRCEAYADNTPMIHPFDNTEWDTYISNNPDDPFMSVISRAFYTVEEIEIR